MSIAPSQNIENDPLLDVMAQNIIESLEDSQKQSVFDENGNRIDLLPNNENDPNNGAEGGE